MGSRSSTTIQGSPSPSELSQIERFYPSLTLGGDTTLPQNNPTSRDPHSSLPCPSRVPQPPVTQIPLSPTAPSLPPTTAGLGQDLPELAPAQGQLLLLSHPLPRLLWVCRGSPAPICSSPPSSQAPQTELSRSIFASSWSFSTLISFQRVLQCSTADNNGVIIYCC